MLKHRQSLPLEPVTQFDDFQVEWGVSECLWSWLTAGRTVIATCVQVSSLHLHRQLWSTWLLTGCGGLHAIPHARTYLLRPFRSHVGEILWLESKG